MLYDRCLDPKFILRSHLLRSHSSPQPTSSVAVHSAVLHLPLPSLLLLIADAETRHIATFYLDSVGCFFLSLIHLSILSMHFASNHIIPSLFKHFYSFSSVQITQSKLLTMAAEVFYPWFPAFLSGDHLMIPTNSNRSRHTAII